MNIRKKNYYTGWTIKKAEREALEASLSKMTMGECLRLKRYPSVHWLAHRVGIYIAMQVDPADLNFMFVQRIEPIQRKKYTRATIRKRKAKSLPPENQTVNDQRGKDDKKQVH